MKKNTIIISLILIATLSVAPGSLYLFSNIITENISIRVAEKYLIEYFNTKGLGITFRYAEKFDIFNYWILSFDYGDEDCSLPCTRVKVHVKWYKVTDINVFPSLA